MFRGPAHQLRAGVGGLIRHALPELRQETALEAATSHALQKAVEVVVAQRMGIVPDRVRGFACSLAFSDLVSHPTQVFQQDNTQGCWQGPKFAEVQLADILIGVQKSREKQRV